MMCAAKGRFEDSMTQFGSFIESFLAYLSSTRNLSENTVRGYGIDLEAFRSWAEKAGIDPLHVTHQQFRRYLASLTRAGYSTRTVNRHLSAIRGIYKWLFAEGLIDEESASSIASPKMSKKLPKTMSDADFRSLLATCDRRDPQGIRDVAMLELLYATGARISEIASLEVRDVNMQSSLVTLFGKGSKERIVPIYDAALRAVKGYLADARPKLAAKAKGKGPGDALFVSIRGNAMSAAALRDRFEACVRRAGLDSGLTPHSMRHTYATELLDGGADLRSVQELLGHESLSTTQIYTHLSIDRLKEATRVSHPRG